MGTLSGKFGIVTAASQGIGLAIARAMASEGCGLIISSSNHGKIEAAAREIAGESGSAVEPKVFDMQSPESLRDFVSSVKKSTKKIDYLVVNFGDPTVAPFLEISAEDWRKYTNMFLHSSVTLIREFLPLFIDGGSIVFVTSMTTKQAYEGFSISGSLRAAVVNFAKILSIELGPRNIRVNCISQGYFMTDRLRKLLEMRSRRNHTTVEEEKLKIQREIPLGRIGEPSEIGDLVVFLCSPRSSYITGTNISIDGGITRYPY
ncbi:MAG TPA: SDR family oxidoreductase [Thermoplasmataceae archaeon]|nr:SDR family oxidoreductase [Thermoplasmatales archaeon AK]HLH86574.1 SDR family oxidoreductase [Thermoplasmataceae archaeon]